MKMSQEAMEETSNADKKNHHVGDLGGIMLTPLRLFQKMVEQLIEGITGDKNADKN